MIIIPAIDIMGGQCVRLSQGLKEEKTVYGDDPVAMARHWVELGAERLHVVDLDGAFGGEPVSLPVIRGILAALEIPVEIGGGIRNAETARSYLDSGAAYVVLGTKAVTDPELVAQLCRSFPGQIIAGIDARKGEVMVEGWVAGSGIGVVELAQRMQEVGVAGIIYTDIHRDGMLSGPNIEATASLADSLQIPVIASGGVSTLDHLRALKAREESGIIGAICGRSLYAGSFTLPEAIAALAAA